MTEFDPVQQEYSRIAHKYDRRWSFYIVTLLVRLLAIGNGSIFEVSQ
jgi:hypothetical protein